MQAVDKVEEQYKIKYPEVVGKYDAEVEQAAALAKELLDRLVFEEPGVTWRSFADDIGHKDFPGCFRCHDGKHLTAGGESIRLALQHLPQHTGDGGRGGPGAPDAGGLVAGAADPSGDQLHGRAPLPGQPGGVRRLPRRGQVWL